MVLRSQETVTFYNAVIISWVKLHAGVIPVVWIWMLVAITKIYICFWGKMKCDVGMMIDGDVAEKRYENKGCQVTKL